MCLPWSLSSSQSLNMRTVLGVVFPLFAWSSFAPLTAQPTGTCVPAPERHSRPLVSNGSALITVHSELAWNESHAAVLRWPTGETRIASGQQKRVAGFVLHGSHARAIAPPAGAPIRISRLAATEDGWVGLTPLPRAGQGGDHDSTNALGVLRLSKSGQLRMTDSIPVPKHRWRDATVSNAVALRERIWIVNATPSKGRLSSAILTKVQHRSATRWTLDSVLASVSVSLQRRADRLVLIWIGARHIGDSIGVYSRELDASSGRWTTEARRIETQTGARRLTSLRVAEQRSGSLTIAWLEDDGQTALVRSGTLQADGQYFVHLPAEIVQWSDARLELVASSSVPPLALIAELGGAHRIAIAELGRSGGKTHIIARRPGLLGAPFATLTGDSLRLFVTSQPPTGKPPAIEVITSLITCNGGASNESSITDSPLGFRLNGGVGRLFR